MPVSPSHLEDIRLQAQRAAIADTRRLISGSRKSIARSRELMARIDKVLARRQASMDLRSTLPVFTVVMVAAATFFSTTAIALSISGYM